MIEKLDILIELYFNQGKKNSNKMIRLRNFLDSLGLIDMYNDTKFSANKIKELKDHKELVKKDIEELSKFLKKEITFNGSKFEILKLVEDYSCKILHKNYRENAKTNPELFTFFASYTEYIEVYYNIIKLKKMKIHDSRLISLLKKDLQEVEKIFNTYVSYDDDFYNIDIDPEVLEKLS